MLRAPNLMSLGYIFREHNELGLILLLAVPRGLFCFGSLVVLDVVFRYLSLCYLYINTKIGKNSCLMLD